MHFTGRHNVIFQLLGKGCHYFTSSHEFQILKFYAERNKSKVYSLNIEQRNGSITDSVGKVLIRHRMAVFDSRREASFFFSDFNPGKRTGS